jgi:hypothetical protein
MGGQSRRGVGVDKRAGSVSHIAERGEHAGVEVVEQVAVDGP